MKAIECDIIILNTNTQTNLGKCILNYTEIDTYGHGGEFVKLIKESELGKIFFEQVNRKYWQHVHLYLVSNEPIIEGFVYDSTKNEVLYYNGNYGETAPKEIFKIEASTDPSLSLPKVSEYFIDSVINDKFKNKKAVINYKDSDKVSAAITKQKMYTKLEVINILNRYAIDNLGNPESVDDWSKENI